jgi:membrane peptidoglycan carboxypeptidase
MVFCGLLTGYYVILDPIKNPPAYGATLRDFKLKQASHVTDVTGMIEIGCFANENRRAVPLSEVSPHLLNAIKASEDHAFEDHKGFNLYAIVRAGLANLISAKIAMGASTTTMQLVKNVFLTPERTVERKMREIVIASHLEHTVPKERIFYLYVNLVYFGGAYGVEAASQSYFGKSAKDVNIPEAAFLAALINQPEAYRLGGEGGKKKIFARQGRVLRLMREHRMITEEEFNLAQKTEIHPQEYSGTCKRIHENINAAINREYGIKGKIPIASAGLNFQTTIELDK